MIGILIVFAMVAGALLFWAGFVWALEMEGRHVGWVPRTGWPRFCWAQPMYGTLPSAEKQMWFYGFSWGWLMLGRWRLVTITGHEHDAESPVTVKR